MGEGLWLIFNVHQHSIYRADCRSLLPVVHMHEQLLAVLMCTVQCAVCIVQCAIRSVKLEMCSVLNRV